MDCNETRRYLEAGLDRELDPARMAEIETHLRGCAECARIAESLRARREALRTSLPRFTAPPELTQKIRAALHAESDAAPPATSPARKRWLVSRWQWSALAASVVLALSVGYVAGDARARGNRLLDEAISDHVRSLRAGHLTDVVSSDQHTVKPWFTGKIDFSPPVADLAAEGFPLAGGRLEYIDGRTAAALVFYRRQHPINVFVWPASGAGIATRHGERAGYATEFWSEGGLNFIAISEISASELTGFIASFRRATR